MFEDNTSIHRGFLYCADTMLLQSTHQRLKKQAPSYRGRKGPVKKLSFLIPTKQDLLRNHLFTSTHYQQIGTAREAFCHQVKPVL
jgi:hypothetical protein